MTVGMAHLLHLSYGLHILWVQHLPQHVRVAEGGAQLRVGVRHGAQLGVGIDHRLGPGGTWPA